MSESKYTANFSGIAELLRSELLLDKLMEFAEAVKADAEENAPVSDPGDYPYNKHSGRYKESFDIRPGEGIGGRVEAVVFNTSPEAIRIEKGNSKIEAMHILSNALYKLKGLL